MNETIIKEQQQLVAKKRKRIEKLLREADPVLFDYILTVVADIKTNEWLEQHSYNWEFLVHKAFGQALMQIQYERTSGKNDVLRFK